MALTKQNLIDVAKTNQKVCDIQHREVGKDENGFPEYEIIYEKPPSNYKLVRIFEHINCAVLEDLDKVSEDGTKTIH